MTQKFLLSQINIGIAEFEKMVANFIKAKKDHLLTEGEPAPTTHPLIEAAVRRIPGDGTIPDDFVADYEIEDDTPKFSVDDRKKALAAKVFAEAQSLTEKIIPPLKSKLWGIHLAEALQVPEDQRTAAHVTTISENQVRQHKVQTLWRHLAEVESQIHDLPEDMIDIWKHPPFPTV